MIFVLLGLENSFLYIFGLKNWYYRNVISFFYSNLAVFKIFFSLF